MRYRNKVCFLFAMMAFVGGLNSCVKKELPVKRHESGDVTTNTANMDATYKYQVYFNLHTNTVVSSNLKTIWDLGFEANTDGYHVVLNTSKSMFAINTGKTDFASVSPADTVGFSTNKKWDASCGCADSTAIGDWRGSGKVYIIDRGFNELGQHQGFEKVQFNAVDANSYTVRFASITGANEISATIIKDSAYNLAFLSFSTGQQLQVEPPKDTWDIVFTQYTYVFYNEVPVMPYLVTGCLLNRYNTQAVLDTSSVFSSINFSKVSSYTFSEHLDVIGYNWKSYNGTVYTINTRNNYIIRDANGMYYKLHFVSFYNNNGVKGNPKWEYQQL